MVKHTIRTKTGGLEKISMTRGIAIKRFCFECMGFNHHEVSKCTDLHCPLYPYRNTSSVKDFCNPDEEAPDLAKELSDSLY